MSAMPSVEEWLDTLALEILFDRKVESHHFNNTRLADAIYTMGIKTVFGAVVARAIELYQVKTERLHGDTPSVCITRKPRKAAYACCMGIPRITVQTSNSSSLVWWSAGGIPLLGDLQSDHETNRFHIQQLRKHVPNLGKSTVIYDGKFCDAKTIGQTRQANLNWITLVPPEYP